MFGIALALVAGICTGSFGFPMKFTTKWKWENTWSMWTVWTLLVVPWVIAFCAIPDLFEVFRQAGWAAIGWVFLFGFIWGFSAIAFGFGIAYLGLALGYSLMMGLIIVVGSLLPLFTENLDTVLQKSGLAIIGGVVVIIIGIAINAWSAIIKEHDLTAASTPAEKPAQKKSLGKGIIICLVAGFTGPMLNYAFIKGSQLQTAAELLGVSKTLAPISIWPIALSAGFFTNLAYCLWLVKKNHAWHLYRAQGTRRYYLYTLIMGLLWAGSIAIFAMASVNLGEKSGPSIGWAVFNTIGIFWANILGILSGEWKGVGKKGLTVMAFGLAILLVGVGILGWANTLSVQ
ncbi:MAG: L-rhamnose-proton symporter [Planctomycetes bacterium ADurb.Bin412]|nr:MAG: L-rhamnose-proton symporter [Planctomycetes bacterium ADurb.Bin412]